MKTTLLLSALFIFGLTGISYAQLEEGNLMLGTDIGSGITNTTSNGLFSLDFGLNDGAGYDLGLSPKVGYFVNDNLVLGAIVNLGYSKSPRSAGQSTETFIYGVQAFTRFYIRPGEANLEELVRTGRFFLENNAGVAGVNVTGGSTTNGFTFGFGPGYSWFLNSYIALEAIVKYNGLVGGGNTDFQNSIGLNLGIQIFIPRAEARERVQELD